MFKMTKQHRYTVPDHSLTYAMDEARLQQTKSWCQYFHQEILDAAKSKTHQKYLTCGEYQTRIAYYLIGAIGDLPPPLRPSVAQDTPTKRKRAKAPVQPKAPQLEEESSSSYHSEFQMDTDEEGDTPIASRLKNKYKEFTREKSRCKPVLSVFTHITSIIW